jgi:hypothetical protein
MHPSRDELRRFVDNELEEPSATTVRNHLKSCDYCRNYVENQHLVLESIKQAEKEAMPQKALKLADRLYEKALAGRIISLKQLLPKDTPLLRLAADGDKEFRPRVENITTLCSENPEIVLRIMRDFDKGHDYLQLISDDPALSSHIIVQIPQLQKEFITDENGRAVIDAAVLDKPDQLSWQIRMPDAIFSLEPLVYDPNKTVYSKDIELTTEKQDKIKVTFEGKTEGKQISIRILELEGRTDFGMVRVSVSQRSATLVKDIKRDESLSFDLVDADSTINIRLYQ